MLAVINMLFENQNDGLVKDNFYFSADKRTKHK